MTSITLAKENFIEKMFSLYTILEKDKTIKIEFSIKTP